MGARIRTTPAHLRTDPLLKQVCGRLPLREAYLASQPTFSWLENVVGARICYRFAEALGAVSLQERERDGTKVRLLEETRFLAERTPWGGGSRSASQGDQHALRGDHPR